MKASLLAVLGLISTIGLVQVNSSETIYFLVGEPPGRALCRDSYVLPLSKQEDIDHARYLISLGASVFEGANAALVGARVGPGKDVINRNYVDPTFRNGPGMSSNSLDSVIAHL